ncbi:nicotinamidase-like [Diadema antillarum]|uniref:nicotinamidase-like n=1 Tax=Diadema antillarum TaxID=105358 RepID=UPI003A857F33
MSDVNYFSELQGDASFSGNRTKEAECMSRYDVNGDGVLDVAEFHGLCEDLLTDENGVPTASQSKTHEIFEKLDENQDGRIDADEFHILWRYWLPMILAPKSAFIVVDVQHDFIDGSLAVNEGETIVPIINKIIEAVPFSQVMYTFDWHPDDHISFFKNLGLRELSPSSPIKKEEAKVFDTVIFVGPPKTEQTLWPAHCVQNSPGARLHNDLQIAENHTNIFKGTNPDIDSYSAFFDNNRVSQTSLTQELCSRRITDVYVCGLAYDVCVRHSAIDATLLGFRTFVIEDATKGLTPESCEKAKKDMQGSGCLFIPSSKVNCMVTASTRLPIMALKAASNVAEARRKAKEKLAAGAEDDMQGNQARPLDSSSTAAHLKEPALAVNGFDSNVSLLDF